MALRAIIHPKMTELLTPGHFPQTVTIEVYSETRSGTGEPTPNWTPLDGHADLPCALAAASDNTHRSIRMIYAEATDTSLINGYYPAILPTHRVVIDGTDYAIEGVDWDSQRSLTRLALRRVVR